MDSMMISLNDIESAQQLIAGRLHRTPLLHSTALGRLTKTELYLKAELFQKTGSFKPRGVFNKVAQLSDEEKRRGLITVSAGNQAQAVRSEEHTSELQSHSFISYAVFCLKKKKKKSNIPPPH